MSQIWMAIRQCCIAVLVIRSKFDKADALVSIAFRVFPVVLIRCEQGSEMILEIQLFTSHDLFLRLGK
jgi:hypothetical protein